MYNGKLLDAQRLYGKKMITLIGHGYIGCEIAREMNDQNISFNWIRHTNQIPPSEIIINASGYVGTPNVDACEDHREEAIKGNVVTPLSIQRLANCPVIHIGSGCLYSGDNEGRGWREYDKANFEGSFYSLTKSISEECLLPWMGNSYILRIRIPFGDKRHPRNLLTKLERYPKLVNFRNSMSNVLDISRVAVWFARHRPDPGIYNVTNPGSISIEDISLRMGLSKEWFTEEEFAASVRVPRSNCVLNVDKLKSIYPIRSIEEAMQESISKYAD